MKCKSRVNLLYLPCTEIFTPGSLVHIGYKSESIHSRMCLINITDQKRTISGIVSNVLKVVLIIVGFTIINIRLIKTLVMV